MDFAILIVIGLLFTWAAFGPEIQIRMNERRIRRATQKSRTNPR